MRVMAMVTMMMMMTLMVTTMAVTIPPTTAKAAMSVMTHDYSKRRDLQGGGEEGCDG